MRDALERIAAAAEHMSAALERIAPPEAPPVDALAHAHLAWDGRALRAVRAAPALPLVAFVGVDAQAAALLAAARALAAGRAAHDALLWGARGTGKSALVRSVAAEVGLPLRLVELPAGELATLPALFEKLPAEGAWWLFADDLAFGAGEPAARTLRSLLDGGVQARPANARLVVTSNHRHLAPREASDTARHARDAEHDALALADRFGLSLGFHVPDQAAYLAMVRGHASGLAYDEHDALMFARERGGFSGRTAWHFAVGLAGR